ncbi:cytochrome P450 [Streptomyces sp. CA-132043]|uniref:cytochrome P450 n=1 Tax=Streptomyces sp. CA-132043 TaxID=3240048 RepID=UPI003D8A41FA
MKDPLAKIPAAPGRLPVAGHLPRLLRRPLGFLGSLREVGPVVRLDLAGRPVCVATSPQAAHDIFSTHGRHFDKGRLFDRLRPVLGNGLITSNGTLHTRQRKLLQPAFNHAHLVSYTQTMARRAEAFAHSWHIGDRLELYQTLLDLTFATAAEVMFSSESAIDVPIAQAMAHVNAGILPQALLPAPLARLPLPPNLRYQRATRQLHTTIDRTVNRYRTEPTERDDLLFALTTARDDNGQPMPDAQIRDEVITLLLAGSETTATVLSWTFYHLGRHPQTEQHLTEEINAVLADRPIEHADIARLTHTRRVLQETARLHPLAVVMRRSNASTTIDGTAIPQNSEVIISPYAIHRDPNLYPEPLTFAPERWITQPAASLPKGAYIPFSEGTRKCIGDHFAWTSMAVILATVLRHCRLAPDPHHHPRELLAAHPHADRLPVTVQPPLHQTAG